VAGENYNIFVDWVRSLFAGLGLVDAALNITAGLALSIVAVLLALFMHFLAKLVLEKMLLRFIARTKSDWDNIFYDTKVFHRALKALPWFIVYLLVPVVFVHFPVFSQFLGRVLRSAVFAHLLLALVAILDAINLKYQQQSAAKQRPIKGYIQLAQVFIYVVAGILFGAAVLDIDPVAILSGFGAMSAVLLLVFKDSLMGLVSSFQLSSNKMVALGDWIEMPKYGADGDVIDITLHTVKVRNWDMTITSIPVYALISDSFKNWRGMSESGGRRIARQLIVDLESVQFCTPAMLERFKKMRLLKDYMQQKELDINSANLAEGLTADDPIGGRRLTNIGTFRAYMTLYLKQHPEINQEMICMVRQQAPTAQGIPLQVYAFTRDKAWINHENIQGDIFDHFFAVMPYFGLRSFQEPSGWDWRNVGRRAPSDGYSIDEEQMNDERSR
jgi:miniconductance mechanosensitive channel